MCRGVDVFRICRCHSVCVLRAQGADGDANGVPWLERPRVLQRSEGFKKSYEEKQAALISHDDVGAQGYHPKPSARLLEELKKEDSHRASVLEVSCSAGFERVSRMLRLARHKASTCIFVHVMPQQSMSIRSANEIAHVAHIYVSCRSRL